MQTLTVIEVILRLIREVDNFFTTFSCFCPKCHRLMSLRCFKLLNWSIKNVKMDQSSPTFYPLFCLVVKMSKNGLNFEIAMLF